MNRLETIKSMVPKSHTVADIGTDHGYVAEMLLNDNIAEKVIASDLNKGPLNRAIEYLTSKNLDSKCDFRLGSGLTVLKEGEADSIIIAGMGGDLTSNILETSQNIAKTTPTLILQPMTAVDKLRKYLYENGYRIVDENIVKEFHHYYFIIKAEIGNVKIKDEIFYEVSIHLLEKNDIIMREYINKILTANNKIIQNLKKANNEVYSGKIIYLEQKNAKILEVLKKYEAV